MAPNLDDIKQYLLRPMMASPPLCSYGECKALTLEELADLHEVLDLRAANAEKLARVQQRR